MKILVLISLASLGAVPLNAQSMFNLRAEITTNEELFDARSTHTAEIMHLDVKHLEAAWAISGSLEHSTDPESPRICNDFAPVAFLAPLVLQCEEHFDYTDCPSARGTYRGRTNTELFIDDTSPDNQRETKRAIPNTIACLDPDYV